MSSSNDWVLVKPADHAGSGNHDRVTGAELELADVLAVQTLKKLRRRSLRNPRWRDADYLHLYLKRSYFQWADDSPLEPKRAEVESTLHRYMQNAKRSGTALDDEWAAVVAAVDSLIAEAERVQGRRIKDTP